MNDTVDDISMRTQFPVTNSDQIASNSPQIVIKGDADEINDSNHSSIARIDKNNIQTDHIEQLDISSVESLIKESESLYEDLENQIAEHMPPEKENEIEAQATLSSVDDVQIQPMQEIPLEQQEPQVQNPETDPHDIQSNPVNMSPEVISIEETHDQGELNPSMEVVNEPPQQQIDVYEIMRSPDIPKPEFTSDDDVDLTNTETPIPIPDSPAISTSPINNQPQMIQLADDSVSVDEEIRLDKLSYLNDDSQLNIEDEPQPFIPSRQIYMTKRTLEEGNSFLQLIINKMKKVNSYIAEKAKF